LKLALRNLVKNKLYSGINLIGLSIGIAAVILIYRIVTYEQSFNKNFDQYDRIVRIVRADKNKEGGTFYTAGVPIPAFEVLKKSIPQFEASAKIREAWPTLLIPNPTGGVPLKKFNLEKDKVAFFVESDFFNVFDWKWLTKEDSKSLDEPNTIVLTRSIAKKCFGTIEASLNQFISIDNLNPYVKVTGVVEDPALNSDFPISYFISYATFLAHPEIYFYGNQWGSTSSNDQFYGLLKSKDQFSAANSAVATVGKSEYKNDRVAKEHFIQPLSNIHYNEEIGTSGGHVVDKKKLMILSFIGIMVLIMACFNFINMANAQSVTRAKEVGIRKTLGISYGQLMSNFLLETSILVGASILIGIGLAFLSAPILQKISSVPIGISLFTGNSFLVFLGMLFVIISLLAGLYPAVVLSSFQPIKIFRSGFENSIGSGTSLRKILVVAQFVIAFGLIISTVIAWSQLSFIRSMDTGFNKDLIYSFSFNNDSSSRAKLNTLKNQLKSISGVENVSLSSDQPSSGNTWSSNWSMNNTKEDSPFSVSLKFCDEDYQETYKLKLLSGHWLQPSDTLREAVLNRTAMKRLGITNLDSVIGKDIRLGDRSLQLVGITEDYQSHSAHEPLEPLLMSTRKEYYFVTSVKIKPNNIPKTLAAIQNAFDIQFPEQVFEGKFYDKEIERFYEADTQFTALCKSFALLAIIISCLGLFALASFAISRRIKEIGVRKVLGATTQNIVQLISKEFLIMVLIAFGIAAPLSWFLMNKWLQDFVYRIDISWWMFAVAILLVGMIAYFTVSIQAIKAAWTNPIKSLRTE
ncbi:MAG: ABC transporter permease, partial [Saprospiraceae bacterium]